MTFICRFLVGRLMLTFNYIYNDKNNPHNALSSRQINLEGNNQTFFLYLHLVVMLFLEIVFPNMFYNRNSILTCVFYTLGTHILVNEPLYYIFHYFLHTPYLYSKMHSVHHSSVKTISTTTALQDKLEHILYVIVFSPATLLPYIYNRQQNGIVIMFYLIVFDIVNSFGHTRINLPDWYNKSFIKYLFYPPSFHINHHIYQKYNFCLFMPIFDKIFGT
jgi:sterol desaturase/sphingolipid hydroxylase (fatty acid hydroxylase superfamily)